MKFKFFVLNNFNTATCVTLCIGLEDEWWENKRDKHFQDKYLDILLNIKLKRKKTLR